MHPHRAASPAQRSALTQHASSLTLETQGQLQFAHLAQRSFPYVLLQGVLQLHSHKPPILHRDLKSPNMLVDRHWRVKVTDFNLSRMVKSGSTNASVTSLLANNPRWLAPEVRIWLAELHWHCHFQEPYGRQTSSQANQYNIACITSLLANTPHWSG